MPVSSTPIPATGPRPGAVTIPGEPPRRGPAGQAPQASRRSRPTGQPLPGRHTGHAAQDGAPHGFEVTATTTAIAGLCRRLQRPGTLDHPAVRRELRKLEEQLAALPEHLGRKPGRHRCQPGTAPGAAREPEPDLAAAHTAAEHLTTP